MKKFKVLIISIVCMSMLMGCTSSDSGYDDYNQVSSLSDYESIDEDYNDDVIDNEYKDDGFKSNEQTSDKLVYTSSIYIDTLEYSKSIKSLDELIDKSKGFIESKSENIYESNWRDSEDDLHKLDIVIRIPSKGYNDFLNDIEKIGKVTSQSSNADNVTREYNDISTQIKSLEIQEKRLLSMYDDAKGIDEMITIERRLTDVQSQLNRIKTQFEILDTDINYSTITIALTEVDKIESHTYWSEVKEAFINSIDMVTIFFRGLSIIVITYLPMTLILCAITFGIVVGIKKYEKKHKTKVNNIKTNEKNKSKKINTDSKSDLT